METLNSLLIGFEIILTWKYLLWCFTGVFLGTLIGLLPGLGSIATIAILLPMAISLSDPTGTLVMMAGIYYGAQYGDQRHGQEISITLASHRQLIDRFLLARSHCAYGAQYEYLDHFNCIGWTRLGTPSHPRAMAVLME